MSDTETNFDEGPDHLDVKRLMDIADKHDLDAHLYASDEFPMFVIGNKTSMESFEKLLDKFDEMRSVLAEIKDLLADL